MKLLRHTLQSLFAATLFLQQTQHVQGVTPTANPILCAIKTVHNTYLSFQSNRDIVDQQTSIGSHEKFEIVQGDGHVAIKSLAHDTYLRFDEDRSVVDQQTYIGSWEKFEIVGSLEGTFSIRNKRWGTYLRAEKNKRNIVDQQTFIGGWEKFQCVPIISNPTLSPSSSPTIGASCLSSVAPYADTRIRNGRFADTNYGSDKFIAMKNDVNPDFRREGLMRFDMSEFWSRYKDSNNADVKAYLRCFVTNVNADPSFIVTVFRMGTNSWTENEVTWNNIQTSGEGIDKDGPDVVIFNPTPGVPSNNVGWVIFDITDLIEGDDLRLIFKVTSAKSAKGNLSFSSREGEKPPQIYFDESSGCFEAPSSVPTLNPSLNPTEGSYDTFVTRDELKDAVSEYCADPDAWTTNSKYAKYGPIEEWDVSSIDDMSNVFYDQTYYEKRNCNPNIADWDVSRVTNFGRMFYGAQSFNQDIGGWDVSNGQKFNYMFDKASSFNQDIGGWDVSKGTRFNNMFWNARSFNQDIGGWNVSNGQYFWGMFWNARSFNQDIGGWNVSNGQLFVGMFQDARSFNQDLCDWDIDDSADTRYFCSGAISCGACSF